jgi:hypothetical protein
LQVLVSQPDSLHQVAQRCAHLKANQRHSSASQKTSFADSLPARINRIGRYHFRFVSLSNNSPTALRTCTATGTSITKTVTKFLLVRRHFGLKKGPTCARRSICPVTAAGSDGRRNTIQCVDSTMLPREKRSVWLFSVKT